MGATYTRQSSSNIVDGNVIEASDINNEYNQLLAAFVASSGHTHDGTAAEGGPITKLLGTAITIGDATAGTDISVTFDGESNDGVFTWMEDEDYFKFSDDLLFSTTEKLQFRDTAIYINSSVDGQLDLVADTEIQIAATTIDINGAVALDGAITGATNITLSGELDAATLDISGNADIDGTTNLDNTDIDGTFAVDGTTISLDATTSLNIDNSNTTNGITLGTATSGVPISIGHTTSETTINDNATVTGNLSVGGTFDVTGTIDFSESAITNAGDIQLDSITGDGDTNTSITFSGLDIITVATGGAGRLTIGDGALSPVTNNQIDLGTSSLEFKDAFFDGTVTADAFAGPLTGNVTGNASGSAATLATARTIGGTSFDGSANIAVALASVGTAVTVADESSDTTCFPLFATAATGDLPPKSGSNLTFNASSGLLTATLLAGDLTGNVTGNTSGTAATVTTAAQSNITSLGTLTALTVDDVAIDGKVVTMTGSASDTAVLTAGTNGTLSIITTDAAAAAANIQITADGTVDIDSAGILTLDSGAAINIEPAVGSAILLDGTISIDAGVVTGATSITSTAFVGDLTGNVTGNTSGTAATVTTAAQSNITSLGTLTTLTVDNVIINGSTIGHTGDTDLITVASGIATVAGEVSMTTLDIGGTNVTTTAAELNLIDGGTARGTDALADGDGILINDGGTMKMTNVTAVKTYMAGSAATAGFALAMAVAL